MSALSAANSPDWTVLFGILGSHPRLGRAPANPEHLSELSKNEQAQLNTGAEEQAEKLRALNAEYEARFPGLRFVTFVNGRTRDVIMVEMRRRIDRGDIEREIAETIQVFPIFSTKIALKCKDSTDSDRQCAILPKTARASWRFISRLYKDCK